MNMLHNCNMYAEGICQFHAGSLVDGIASGSSYELSLVGFVGFLVVPLTSLVPTTLPPLSSTGFPKTGLMFDCGSLYLFLSCWVKSL